MRGRAEAGASGRDRSPAAGRRSESGAAADGRRAGAGPRPVFDRGFAALTALAVAGMAGVLLRDGAGAVWTIVLEDLGLLARVAPKVAAGVLIATLLPLFVDPASLNRLVGPERGWRGLAVGAAAGAASPGGPSVVLPLAAGLLAAGADRGAAVAFVTGWVLLGVNRTLVWELSFLPHDLVWTRLLICLPAPVLAGLAARRLAAAP